MTTHNIQMKKKNGSSWDVLYPITLADNVNTKNGHTVQYELEHVFDKTATPSSNGAMSAADKSKLNQIEEGANNYIHPNTSSIRHVTDAQIALWNDKYTRNEIDVKFNELHVGLDWKESVDTYTDIATTYPNPKDGWTVNTKDTDITYRYTGTTWIQISANSIPLASSSVDGKMSKEDKRILDSLNVSVANIQQDLSTLSQGVTGDFSAISSKISTNEANISSNKSKITALETSKANASHNHDGIYAATSHIHDNYADLDHNHDDVYLSINGGKVSGDIILKKTDSKLEFQDNSGKITSRIRTDINGALIISPGASKEIYIRPNGDTEKNGQVLINDSGVSIDGNIVSTEGHGHHIPEPVQDVTIPKFLRCDNSWVTITPDSINAAEKNHRHNFSELGGAIAIQDLEQDIFFSPTADPTKARGIVGRMATNDCWRVVGAGNSEDDGYLEIATSDNGTEPIYVRQYASSSGTNRVEKWKQEYLRRTLTLLDSSGNTILPGTLTATTKVNINGGGKTASIQQGGAYLDIDTNATTGIRFLHTPYVAGTNDYKIYHEGYKPTPAAIGALPSSGGTMTGNLNIVTNSSELSIGVGRSDVFLANLHTDKYLQLTNDGILSYSDERIYHEGFKQNELPCASPKRPVSADIPVTGDGALRHYKATSTMTENKPYRDGHILNLDWDTTAGYNSQLFIGNSVDTKLQMRGQSAGTWGEWHTVYSTNNKPSAEDVGALPISGGTMTGDITLGTYALKGTNNMQILRDYGNGNVAISASKKTDGTAGDIYLGFNDSKCATSKIRLCSPMVDSGANGTVIDTNGNLNLLDDSRALKSNGTNILRVTNGQTVLSGKNATMHFRPKGDTSSTNQGTFDTNGILTVPQLMLNGSSVSAGGNPYAQGRFTRASTDNVGSVKWQFGKDSTYNGNQTFEVVNKNWDWLFKVSDNGKTYVASLYKDGNTKNYIWSDDGGVSYFNLGNSEAGYLHCATVGHGAKGIDWWSSDLKLKHNVEESKNISALDIVNKLKHYSFTYNDTEEHVECGYVSQQLEEINKGFVTKVIQPEDSPYYDEADPYVRQPIAGKIIPYLSKAIQEQQLMIEELQKQIKALQDKCI